jgi:hypothetical protein
VLVTVLVLRCGGPANPSPDSSDVATSPDGQCVPDCEDKFCGPDGCGGTCPDTCDGICDRFTGICSTEIPCDPNCKDKACGDDGCGGECPDTCTGVCDQDTGICDTGTTPATGCTGENDTHAYAFQDIGAAATNCMQEAGTSPVEATACLSNETGLSDTCMACWSTAYQCVFDPCSQACIDTMTTECTECIDTQCAPAFEQCAGVPLLWE